MEKITKHFKERITDLSILFIVICNYFGLLFIINSSSYIIGVVLSLIFSLLIGVSCWYVKEKLIENKNINFKNKLINKFILLWVSFIIIGLFNYVIISHIYNINFTYKEIIQKNVSEKLSSVQAYSDELNRRIEVDYQNQHAKIKETKRQLGFTIAQSNEMAINITSPSRNIASNNQIRINKNIKSKTTNFEKVFKEWHVTDLMKNYNDLIKYNQDNYNDINGELNKLPIDRSRLTEPFNKNILPLNKPFQFNVMLSEGLNSYLIPFLLILITHLIVLVPYFKTPTEETSGGKEPEGAYIIEL
jgi:hypothetical protein